MGQANPQQKINSHPWIKNRTQLSFQYIGKKDQSKPIAKPSSNLTHPIPGLIIFHHLKFTQIPAVKGAILGLMVE